jgi:hypothetical protein
MMHEHEVPAHTAGESEFKNAGVSSLHVAPASNTARLTFRQFVISAHLAFDALPNRGGKLHGVVAVRRALLAVQNALEHVSCTRDANPESVDELLRMLRVTDRMPVKPAEKTAVKVVWQSFEVARRQLEGGKP